MKNRYKTLLAEMHDAQGEYEALLMENQWLSELQQRNRERIDAARVRLNEAVSAWRVEYDQASKKGLK